jgi:multidrug resistance efflux pump
VQLGDSVAPGAPVLQIIDDSRLHVDATIDEADVARVRPGQSAELHLDALPERNIAGKVVTHRSFGEARSEGRTNAHRRG